MYPAIPLVFTNPSGTTLTGGRTNYMVVFDSPGDEEVLLDAHVCDGYGSNSLPGFAIRNRIHYKTGDRLAGAQLSTRDPHGFAGQHLSISALNAERAAQPSTGLVLTEEQRRPPPMNGAAGFSVENPPPQFTLNSPTSSPKPPKCTKCIQESW